MKQISSCTLDCQDTCSTVVKTDADGRVSITGNPDHPFTRGVICAKGKRAFQRLTSPHRITTPLLKRAGTFEPTSWARALDLIAEKLKALRHEPATILHVRGYGYRGVFSEGSNYLFNLLGASSTRGSLCDEAGCTAFIADFGALEMNAPEELLNAGHMVNWGKDFSRSSLHLAGMVKKARKKGCSITTISPGGDGNKSYSDHLIRIRPANLRHPSWDGAFSGIFWVVKTYGILTHLPFYPGKWA
jgi:anaerobic selenocysteine-containing dehydrogenase